MPLYELLEELFSLFEMNRIKEQDAYLFAFFDAVKIGAFQNPLRRFYDFGQRRVLVLQRLPEQTGCKLNPAGNKMRSPAPLLVGFVIVI